MNREVRARKEEDKTTKRGEDRWERKEESIVRRMREEQYKEEKKGKGGKVEETELFPEGGTEDEEMKQMPHGQIWGNERNQRIIETRIGTLKKRTLKKSRMG